MVLHISKEDLRKEEIPIDPNIPLHSVAKLLEGPDFCSKRLARRACDEAIPIPAGFTAQGRDLMKLRASSAWKTGNRDDQVNQMASWFPDIKELASPTYKRPKLQPAGLQSRAKLQKKVAASSYQTTPCPDSNIGTLAKLPGEIRNRIYRLATVSPDPIHVFMPFRTCGVGRCLHTSVAYNVPGIAQTCKQLRWEALPIYLVENSGVQFNPGATHDGCAVNYLKSLGDYADLIPKYTFVMQRPIWTLDKFEEYAIYHFSVTTPNLDGSGEYAVEQWEKAGRKVCQCVMEELMENLNKKKKMGMLAGKAMLELLDHEDFADFLWRMKKTKQWPQHLAKCKKCKEIVFNS